MSAQVLQGLFYTLISFIIFPFALFNFILTKTPIFSNIKPFLVVSGSMEPAISTGSIIYTEKQSSYKTGDIITFILNKKIISHRIESIVLVGHTIYYSTRGDANAVADMDLVARDNVYGKIFGAVPMVGSVILAYKTQFGLISGTVLPTLLLLFYAVRKNRYKATLLF